jgi:hypothetical protein
MRYSARAAPFRAQTSGLNCDVADAGQVLQAQDGVSPPHEHVRVPRARAFRWMGVACAGVHVGVAVPCEHVCVHARVLVRLCMLAYAC